MGVCLPGRGQGGVFLRVMISLNWTDSRGTMRTPAVDLIPLARNVPTNSACTTCTETCGNGAGTATTQTITPSRRHRIHSAPPRPPTVWSGAARGSTTRRDVRARVPQRPRSDAPGPGRPWLPLRRVQEWSGAKEHADKQAGPSWSRAERRREGGDRTRPRPGRSAAAERGPPAANWPRLSAAIGGRAVPHGTTLTRPNCRESCRVRRDAPSSIHVINLKMCKAGGCRGSTIPFDRGESI